MSFEKQIGSDYSLIKVSGRLDVTNSESLENEFNELINLDSPKVIADCSGLDYISSSGLRVFLLVLKKISAKKGSFILSGLQANIKQVFDISGFTSLFKLAENNEEAEKML